MFDKFKSELSEIKPDEGLKANIIDKIEELEARTPDKKTKLKLVKIRWTAAVAAMVALCLIGVSVFDIFGGNPIKTGENSSVGSAPTISAESDENASFKVPFASYDRIYEAFKNAEQTNRIDMEYETGTVDTGVGWGAGVDVLEDDKGADNAPTAKPGGSAEYSDTNVQVEGVDEADIVKTDGEYIFTLSKSRFSIFYNKVNAGKFEATKSIDLAHIKGEGDKFSLRDMYYDSDRLTVIGILNNSVITVLVDVTDKNDVKIINILCQDGRYVSSRYIDGILYLVTHKGFYEKPEKDELSTYVPLVGARNNTEPIKEEDILIADDDLTDIDTAYTVVTTVDTKNAKQLNVKAILSGSDCIYMNSQYLFVTGNGGYVEEKDVYTNSTNIIKFKIDKGNITPVALGRVRGALKNQFSLDADGEYLRIVTSIGSFEKKEISYGGTASGAFGSSEPYYYYSSLGRETAVSILDGNLKICGGIKNIAPGETLHSVRFMGQLCYFVTFRQTDPLFAVDVSDPKNPKLLSELKVPGFSEYLHPWDEGQLLGIGMEADEETGRTSFVKLSMFDITNPENVTEENKTLVENEYYSEALYNHKAVLINKSKNLIAFGCNNTYYVWGYDQKSGFTKKAQLNIGSYNESRGMFINDVLYVTDCEKIISYSLKDFEEISRVVY